jgi:hypothetical protein
MSPSRPPIPSAPESARWGGVYAAATAVLGLATAAGFFWPVAREGLAASALLVLVAGIAAGSGRVAAGLLGLRGPEEGAKTVVGMTLGLGLLSLAVLALAAGGVLKPWTIAVVLVGLWIAGFSELRAAVLGLRPPEEWREHPVAASAILAALGLTFWLAWAPPHQYDSLVYHLALPAAYLRSGGLTTAGVPVYAHFPQNGEMLFTLALALRSDLLAQLFMWLATALSVAWLWTMAGAEIPVAARLLAALLLATHTGVMLLASTTYVEPLVMLWTTAAVLLFWRWRREGGAAPRSWLALSAIFAGLALGAKYTAGLTAGGLGLILLKDWLTGPPAARRARVKDLALFSAVVTLVFSPWLVKNALSVGNPVFPFFYDWFPATAAGWPAEGARRYFAVLTEYGHGGAWVKALLELPVQLLGNSLRFGGGMDVLGDMGWEVLFWALPLAAWAAWQRRNRTARWLFAFCVLYLAGWFATGVVLRFLTVLAPLLCLLAAFGLHALWSRLGVWGRSLLAAGVGILAATHVLVFLYAHAVFGSGRVLSGLETREEFLSRRLDYYPCAVWARERLGRNDRILIVGEQRAYYWEQDNLATTVNAPNRWRDWADASASPRDFAAKLKGEGFTRVAVMPKEARRLANGLDPFSAQGARNWLGLETGFTALEYQAPACAVYRLR